MSGDAPHRFLFEAFCYRIKLVQEGGKNTGPLPSDVMDSLPKRPEIMQRYVVDRLRQHSKILEPEEKVLDRLDREALADCQVLLIDRESPGS